MLDPLKNNVFLLVLIVMMAIMEFSSCALPKQPELTLKESAYFKTLKESCNCPVLREVNPRASKGGEGQEKGWYYFRFDSIPCHSLYNMDSLKQLGFDVARTLHKKVLDEGFPYGYEYISIVFQCYESKSLGRSKSFEFYPKELEAK